MPRDFESESRLADASRAGQGDEPMVVYEADHLCYLDLSPDHIRCLGREVRRRAWRRNVRGRSWLRPLAMVSEAWTNLGSELVAATDDGPNEVVVRESPAQCFYLGLEIVVLNNPAWPDPAHQLVFADDGPVGLDQHDENIESTPAEFHRLTVGEHFAALRQDPETTEFEARRRFGCGMHGRRL